MNIALTDSTAAREAGCPYRDREDAATVAGLVRGALVVAFSGGMIVTGDDPGLDPEAVSSGGDGEPEGWGALFTVAGEDGYALVPASEGAAEAARGLPTPPPGYVWAWAGG